MEWREINPKFNLNYFFVQNPVCGMSQDFQNWSRNKKISPIAQVLDQPWALIERKSSWNQVVGQEVITLQSAITSTAWFCNGSLALAELATSNSSRDIKRSHGAKVRSCCKQHEKNFAIPEGAPFHFTSHASENYGIVIHSTQLLRC